MLTNPGCAVKGKSPTTFFLSLFQSLPPPPPPPKKRKKKKRKKKKRTSPGVGRGAREFQGMMRYELRVLWRQVDKSLCSQQGLSAYLHLQCQESSFGILTCSTRHPCSLSRAGPARPHTSTVMRKYICPSCLLIWAPSCAACSPCGSGLSHLALSGSQGGGANRVGISPCVWISLGAVGLCAGAQSLNMHRTAESDRLWETSFSER